mgnify:CR=1 FL=1
MPADEVADPALVGWRYLGSGCSRGPYTVSQRQSEGNPLNTVYDVYKEGRPTRLAKALRSLEAAQRAAWRDEHPPPPKKVDPINPTLLWDIGTQLERLSWEFRRAANAKRSERAGQIESVVDDIDRLLAPYRQ